MLIRIYRGKEAWEIRTVDDQGATWTRRSYKTARGVVRAVERLQSKGHIIGSQRDTDALDAARAEDKTRGR